MHGNNPILNRLPQHLKQYLCPQVYSSYTAVDQAVWRYVMRKNVDYLTRHAHKSYASGLQKTGISIDSIPKLENMNQVLQESGWAAAAVSGFIPPRAFMEFQAYNVLVIACEIRQREHIEYTPAPDILHEAAGHAPLLANPEYAAFLKRFGEIGCKAISKPHNHRIFHAIRKLSILKEHRDSNPRDIRDAEQEVKECQEAATESSEMDQLRNLHWWSVEYGLIGTPENYKLYGAGLLSSIGESQGCRSKSVHKKPFTPEVIHQKFDITRPQPQLFVTPNFAHLSKVLETVVDGMALRKGGMASVRKLVDSQEVGTVELSTGLQISGCFKSCLVHPKYPLELAYIQTEGNTALSYRNQELIGHSCATHPKGFGFPIGALQGSNLAIEDMTPSDLEAFGLVEGTRTTLTFTSGLVVEGIVVTGIRNIFGKIMIIRFNDCRVRFEDQLLFLPHWGPYDMAVGKSIPSVYAGPADPHHFPFEKQSLMAPKPPTIPKGNDLYQAIEDLNQQNSVNPAAWDTLGQHIIRSNRSDGLLWLNFYEGCLTKKQVQWADLALKYLMKIKKEQKNQAHFIEEGLRFCKSR